MRLGVSVVLVACGCVHGGLGPPATLLYTRGTFEGSEGVFLRRIGGDERRLLAGDGSTTVQPEWIDRRGRVVYTRDADEALCPRRRCAARHRDGYYSIDPAVGVEQFLTPFHGGNVELIGGDRVVYDAGDQPSLHPSLRSVATDGSGDVEIDPSAWLCGGTADGRVVYLRQDARQLVVANSDGSDPRVIGDDVPGLCGPAAGMKPEANGILPDGRLVFEGRPPGGGARGEYVATLDGAARLLTTATAAVFGATTGDRFVVETFVPDERWPGQLRRDRIEVLVPGEPPTISLDLTHDYDQLTDVTPTGRLIVGRLSPRSVTPAEDYWSIDAGGARVALATSARYWGTTGGRVVIESIQAVDDREHLRPGVWSVPETGGAPTWLAHGTALAIVDGWVVYVDGGGGARQVLGAVSPDGALRHVLHVNRDDIGVDDLGGGWISYRDDDDVLHVARVDGGEDDEVGRGASFVKLIPDRSAR